MSDVPLWAWVSAAVVAAGAVVTFLRSFAVLVRNDLAVHDLRRKVYEVRIRHLEHMVESASPVERPAQQAQEQAPSSDEDQPTRLAA